MKHLHTFESFVEDTKNNKRVEEGNKFVYAAAKAKQEGKEEFEFNGKKYPVTIKDTDLKK